MMVRLSTMFVPTFRTDPSHPQKRMPCPVAHYSLCWKSPGAHRSLRGACTLSARSNSRSAFFERNWCSLKRLARSWKLRIFWRDWYTEKSGLTMPSRARSDSPRSPSHIFCNGKPWKPIVFSTRPTSISEGHFGRIVRENLQWKGRKRYTKCFWFDQHT